MYQMYGQFGEPIWQPSNYCHNLGLYPNPMMMGNIWQPNNINYQGGNFGMFTNPIMMQSQAPVSQDQDMVTKMMQSILVMKQLGMLENSSSDGGIDASYSGGKSFSRDDGEREYMSKYDPKRLEKLESAWSDKAPHLDTVFYERVLEISDKLKCHPEDLMAVMSFESAGSLKANKANSAGSGAMGLIQFMPKTARSLGTSTSKLARMSETEQLDYVEKYLIRAKRTAKISSNSKLDLGALYGLILAPAHAAKDVWYTKADDGSKYTQNKNIDVKYGDNDGKIERVEAAELIAEHHWRMA